MVFILYKPVFDIDINLGILLIGASIIFYLRK